MYVYNICIYTGIVERLSAGTVSLLVCSDAMARGIDVPGVDVVINYEAPTMIKTYVHRAGRTARAGRAGKCYTMLTSDQVQGFKALLRLADNNYVRSVRVKEHLLLPFRERYRGCLAEWQVVMEAERTRDQSKTQALQLGNAHAAAVQPRGHAARQGGGGTGAEASTEAAGGNVFQRRAAFRRKLREAVAAGWGLGD